MFRVYSTHYFEINQPRNPVFPIVPQPVARADLYNAIMIAGVFSSKLGDSNWNSGAATNGATAITVEEAKQVLKAGFDYVTEKNGIVLFKRPKRFSTLYDSL